MTKAEQTPIVFTTPVGKVKVEIKPFITGFDQEAIDAAWNTPPEKGEEHLPAAQRVNRKSLQIVILSVGGDSKDVVKKILELDSRDYQAVITRINKLAELPQTTKKK